jgi:hypothetical protein
MENRECFDFLKGLNKPEKIQEYLYSIRYNTIKEIKSPKRVIENKTAHCLEGSILAAAALRLQGYKPLIIDMLAVNDDDHVIALFKKNNYWGAISKSNTPFTEYREPVYKNVRELVMSYFDFYFNQFGQKTLRTYSMPLNLTQFDNRNWVTQGRDLTFIEDKLNRIHHYPLLTRSMKRSLLKVNGRLLKAGFLGAIKEGIYPSKQR